MRPSATRGGGWCFTPRLVEGGGLSLRDSWRGESIVPGDVSSPCALLTSSMMFRAGGPFKTRPRLLQHRSSRLNRSSTTPHRMSQPQPQPHRPRYRWLCGCDLRCSRRGSPLVASEQQESRAWVARTGRVARTVREALSPAGVAWTADCKQRGHCGLRGFVHKAPRSIAPRNIKATGARCGERPEPPRARTGRVGRGLHRAELCACGPGPPACGSGLPVWT
jgi:hypothetical protein